MGMTRSAKRIRDAKDPPHIAPVRLADRLTEKLAKSLIGYEALEARPWTPEDSTERWHAGGRKCELCTRPAPATNAVLYTVSKSLTPGTQAAWGLEFPSFVVCGGCWAFLSSVSSWELLENRIEALQRIIVAALRKKVAKTGRNLTTRDHFLRIGGTLAASNTPLDASEAPAARPEAPWTRRRDPEADGDDGEDEF